jgi:hypothetical protein
VAVTEWFEIGAAVFAVICLFLLYTIADHLANIEASSRQIRKRIAPTDFEIQIKNDLDHLDPL